MFVNFVEQSKIETYHKTLALLQVNNYVPSFFWSMEFLPREGHMVLHEGKIYAVTHTFSAPQLIEGKPFFTNQNPAWIAQVHMAIIVPMPERF